MPGESCCRTKIFVGTILKTTDGGTTWNSLESSTSNHLIGVSFTDQNNGTAVGLFGTAIRTTDEGNTWNNILSSQVQSFQVNYNGAEREYFVFLPQNYIEQSNLPLMLTLHGSGSNGISMLGFSPMCSVADTAGFIAVYPSAIGGIWNHPVDVGFISALIDTMGQNYNVDLSRVYACGFSRGGYLSHELGCQLSDKIAAIAPVAGTILSSTLSNCSSTAFVPVFYMHGTHDPTVPYSGVAQTLDFWIERNQANAFVDTVELPVIDPNDGSTVIKYSYRDIDSIAKVVFYKVVNGGHQWPGSLNTVTSGGNKNMDINTSEEIWKFVKNFQNKPTGISYNTNVFPIRYNLFQNYPNPFNPITTISWQSPVGSHQTLKVYDLLGREVATLVDEYKPAGGYEVEFNIHSGLPSGEGRNLTSGVYFYQLKAGEFADTKKLILLK